MTKIFISLIGLFLAANPAEAATNSVQKTTDASSESSKARDPVEDEYQKILDEDDKAHEEIDKWIRDAQAFEEKGAGSPQTTLNARIEKRQKDVGKLYESFLEKNPKHALARIAYGSFLNDAKDDHTAAEQWEKARELDPTNPSVWNNLANYYGHRSPVKKAFEYYAKAIELNPKEPVYHWNYATTVYLFRQDAQEHFTISESEVFEKALALYREAMKLDPTNFILSSDYASSFYGTKPPRYEEGLKAWEEALKVARDDVEREGVQIHLARCKINLGQLDAAQTNLNLITNKMYLDLKEKLERRIARDKAPKETNAAPATVETK